MAWQNLKDISYPVGLRVWQGSSYIGLSFLHLKVVSNSPLSGFRTSYKQCRTSLGNYLSPQELYPVYFVAQWNHSEHKKLFISNFYQIYRKRGEKGKKRRGSTLFWVFPSHELRGTKFAFPAYNCQLYVPCPHNDTVPCGIPFMWRKTHERHCQNSRSNFSVRAVSETDFKWSRGWWSIDRCGNPGRKYPSYNPAGKVVRNIFQDEDRINKLQLQRTLTAFYRCMEQLSNKKNQRDV